MTGRQRLVLRELRRVCGESGWASAEEVGRRIESSTASARGILQRLVMTGLATRTRGVTGRIFYRPTQQDIR